jgi:tripartite-type tricarboxylate transporter receptor subunit TctC
MKIRFGYWSLALVSLYGPLSSEDFYKGKTVRIIVGGSAGGGFDTYSRVMARPWKHIRQPPSLSRI